MTLNKKFAEKRRVEQKKCMNSKKCDAEPFGCENLTAICALQKCENFGMIPKFTKIFAIF